MATSEKPTKQQAFCCTHPQQRIDTPEPPSRPLASIDGIFAAAALPEYHPHALQFSHKKPGVDEGIVRSPGWGDKLKMQWGRKKSVKGLRKEGEYDEDAVVLGSREVSGKARGALGSEKSDGGSQGGDVAAPAVTKQRSRCVSPIESNAEIRRSLLGSAEYLMAVIEQPSIIAVAGPSYNIVDVATQVAEQRVLEDVEVDAAEVVSVLPKSLSSPLLSPRSASLTAVPARRTRSEVALDESLRVPKHRAASRSDTDLATSKRHHINDMRAISRATNLPLLHIQEPTTPDDGASRSGMLTSGQAKVDEGPHLHTMDISHQLRSMSQLSDPMEDDVSILSSNPWNFHHRERSGIGFDASGRSRHSRIKSSTGMDSATVPSAWGRVRSPTAASSIYSRPTSAGPNANELDRPPYTVPLGMSPLSPDWPLRPSACSDGSASKISQRDKPLPPMPSDTDKDDAITSITAGKQEDISETTLLSPPRESIAAPRTSSSSVFTDTSKKSRFLERFSPPKRTVKKRRSIFKFLRPGSRKQQTRSISSPVLVSAQLSSAGAYDGPSDDPALLTVQYELTEQPQHPMRSASMSQLGPTTHATSTNQLPSLHSLQRQPTLADYERNLSVTGDDRRRPPSVNLARLTEIQEEDRRESIGIRRKLSRAKELKDDASPLMAQALTKHQQEKDAFCSSSKRRDTTDSARRQTPVFAQSTFGGSSLAATPEDESEPLDPLVAASVASSAPQRLSSSAFLSPADATRPSRTSSTATGSSAVPATVSSLLSRLSKETISRTAPRHPKIGTSLASWSRYPSHNRFERCGSAGKADNVIARDFAFDFDPVGLHASDDSDAGSTGPHPGMKVDPKQAKKLQKSRSLTFGSIMRYYSNLFHTSGWAGQNRRTSITVGGRLEHPELEMLPPQIPTERQHEHDTLKHFKDIVKEDAEMIKDFVQEEEGKIGHYVREEEDRLESFVREEEDKLEKFVEEEEDKLGDFVKKEEGKFMKFVHDEEDKWTHRHSSGPSGTSFRHGSMFKTDNMHHDQRRDTMIGPNNDTADEAPPSALHLDGAAAAPEPGLPKSEPSKAQLWSDIYQQCIQRPPSKEPLRSESMPPPLGQPKPRIRRFPSVTVIDDRKGHYRSISLISVKTSRS